jgi:hypothetical protein
MPKISCPCGGELRVEYWHAGSDRESPKCQADVSVPPLDVLKRLGGDLHPELNDWEKLVVAKFRPTINNQANLWSRTCVDHDCASRFGGAKMVRGKLAVTRGATGGLIPARRDSPG